MFSACPKPIDRKKDEASGNSVSDIEDFGTKKSSMQKRPLANVNKRKRSEDEFSEEELNKSWREVLGNPPAYGVTKVCFLTISSIRKTFLLYHKMYFCLGATPGLDCVSKTQMEISGVTAWHWKTINEEGKEKQFSCCAFRSCGNFRWFFAEGAKSIAGDSMASIANCTNVNARGIQTMGSGKFVVIV